MFNATITGAVGKVDEVQKVGGTSVLNFSVAHNAKRGEDTKTTWFECAIWGPLAEVLNIGKGDKVTIIAKEISANAYADRDGNPQAALKVTVDRIDIQGKAQAS